MTSLPRGFLSRLTLAVAVTALATHPLSAQDRGEGGKKAPIVEGLKTYSQTGWGGGSDGEDRARSLLNKHFEQVFRDGMRIGRKRDGLRFHVLTSADEVKALLPIQGAPAPMRDGSKAGLKAAGGLAGQLIAAKLNVAFDKSGLLGKRAGDEPRLIDLVLRGNDVPRPLRGVAVRTLIQLADDAVAGAFGSDVKPSRKAADVDGDEDPDASLMDIREALHVLNTNYKAGRKAGRGLTRSDEETAGRGGGDRDGETDGDDDDVVREEHEEEIEQAEEERDDEILEAEEERRREREEAEREGKQGDYERRRREIDDRYEDRRRQVLGKFEEKQARIHAKFEERHGRPHPGKGHGVKGVPPGQSKKGGGNVPPGQAQKKGGGKVPPGQAKKQGGGDGQRPA